MLEAHAANVILSEYTSVLGGVGVEEVFLGIRKMISRQISEAAQTLWSVCPHSCCTAPKASDVIHRRGSGEHKQLQGIACPGEVSESGISRQVVVETLYEVLSLCQALPVVPKSPFSRFKISQQTTEAGATGIPASRMGN